MPIHNNVGVTNNVRLDLGIGVSKANFRQKVDTALADNKLTKTEYDQIKSKMVNGKQSLNELLSNVGVASKAELGQIFANKSLKNKIVDKFKSNVPEKSVEITPLQKSLIKSIISDKNPLNQDELKSQETFRKLYKPADHNNKEQRYGLTDVLFNPKMSNTFKKQCEKEFSVENFNFTQDLKTTIENPSKEALKEIYNNYVKTNSPNMINISSKERYNAQAVFENPNSTMAEMMKVLESPANSIMSIMKDTHIRYLNDGVKEAVRIDYNNIKDPDMQDKFLDNLAYSKDNGNQGAKLLIQERADNIEKALKASNLI